jgi:phosphoglycerol transferase MdoB-like AlkP superfamily enzyme
MQEQDRLEDSDYISDRSTYDEILHQLRTSGKPLFAHVVTMQNHVPMSDWYHDPIPVTHLKGDEAAEVSGFARGLKYTDKELPRFLNALRAMNEPTVLVFFGDHYPGIFSEATKSANPGLALYKTPMFIWSSQDESVRDLGLTDPIEFLPLLMDRIGAPLPPYYELLHEVADRVGALRRDGVVRSDGRLVPYEELEPNQIALLHDLRLVQYDFSVGKRYAVDRMWYSTAH